jgi:hypothetical protein
MGNEIKEASKEKKTHEVGHNGGRTMLQGDWIHVSAFLMIDRTLHPSIKQPVDQSNKETINGRFTRSKRATDMKTGSRIGLEPKTWYQRSILIPSLSIFS